MSKTSQRVRSAYQLGLSDGLIFRGIRWRRHPQMKDYMRGYRKGRRAWNLFANDYQ